MKLISYPQVILANVDSVNITNDEIKYPLFIGNDVKFVPINVLFDNFSEMIEFIHNRNEHKYNPYKMICERITIDDYEFMGLDIDTINVNKLTAVLTYNFTRKRKKQ